MPRSAAIGRLATGFTEAAAAQDWERLGVLAAALAPQLAALTARGAWNGTETRALAQLRAAHDNAAADCGAALASLGSRLADMRNNKDGWMAYALSGEHETAGHDE